MTPGVRRALKGLSAALATSLVLGGLAALYLWFYYHTPASHVAEERVVSIAPGASVAQIATTLVDAGLLRHRWPFILYATRLSPGRHLG